MQLGKAGAGRRRRIATLTTIIALVLVIVSAAIVFEKLDLGARRSEMYNPEREALVEANWQLAQSSPHQAASASPTGQTHGHIISVLNWLDRAEGVRSDHRRQIDQLREKVQVLADEERIVEAGMARRNRLYNEISSELQILIDHYGDSEPKR